MISSNATIKIKYSPKVRAQILNAREIMKDPNALTNIKSLAQFKRVFGFLLFSDGNEKLVSSKRVRFLIFNLPSVKTCPNATPHCIDKCYAKRAEAFREEARDCRARNYALSRESWFKDLLIKEIELRLQTPSFKGAEFIFVRIHESGDFYSADYLADWLFVARYFLYESRMFYGFYTKSFDLFKSVDLPRNMTPSASLWDDTTEEDRELIAELVKRGWQIYSADTAERIAERKKNGERFHVCTCADCGACAFCYKPHKGARTDVVIH